MKRIIFLSAVLLLSGAYIFAQKEYKQAYIITNDNDSIYGLVNTDTDIRLSGVCLFKLNDNSDPVKYLPENLIGYRIIDGKYFVTRLIPFGDNYEKKFVEYLINGIISIYTYASPDGVRYFAQKEGDDKLQELIYKEEEVYVKDTRYLKIDKQYLNTLKVLMINTPELSAKLEKVNLGRKSLIDISKDYHNLVCTDHSCITYEKKLNKPVIELGLVPAYNYSDIMKFTTISTDFGEIDEAVFDQDFGYSRGFAFGLSAKLFLPGFKNKFFVRYESMVVKHEFQTTYYIGDIYDRKDITITSTHMQHFFSGGLYLFNSGVRPVIEAGFGFTHSLAIKYTGYDVASKGGPLNDMISIGFSLAAGASIKLSPGYYVDVIAEMKTSNSVYRYLMLNEYNLKIDIPIIRFNKK